MAGNAHSVRDVLTFLERRGTKKNRDGMARYAITAPKAFGVSVATLQQLAKRLGRDHELALALWDTGWYEARMLAAFVDEPARVTSAQMDRWAKDFDNWAICDTHCFHLFDRTPHAWKKVRQWSRRREEFVKRAAFALARRRRAARQEGARRAVSRRASAGRTRGSRRSQLRQERRELGVANGRPPEPGTACGDACRRTPPGGIVRAGPAVDRTRRRARAEQPCGPEATGGAVNGKGRGHHSQTRSAGARKSRSPGATLNASWNSPRCPAVPLVRNSSGAYCRLSSHCRR